MLFSFVEIPESRSSTLVPPSNTFKYKATGETDDVTVQLWAISATPLAIFTLLGPIYRQDIKVDPDGYAQYIVTVPYAQRQRQPNTYTINFDTTGATINKTFAITHINDYAASGTPPNYLGAIGANAQGECEGVDVVVPSLKISVQFHHSQGSLNQSYIKSVAGITGSVNTDSFLGFDADELLFLGATCSQGANSDGTSSETDATYQFAASKNATGLTISGISGIDKKGWEYSWINYASHIDANGHPITIPMAFHVEQVYPRNAFGSVFPFGS